MITLYALLTVVLLAGILISIFKIIETIDDDEKAFCSGILLGCIIGFSTVVINLSFLLPNEYKKGQIDALTNNIKYELKENPDKTKEWIEIKTK